MASLTETRTRKPKPGKIQGGTGVIALGAIPLILFLLGLILMNEFEDSRALREQVDQSHESRLAVQRVLSLHQDIETGQRGYVLTGSENFLDPYRAALAAANSNLELLERSVREQKELHDEIAILLRLSQAQRTFAAQSVQLRREGRTEDAVALIRTGRGKAIMDAIRVHIAKMDAAERQRLATSTARADEARSQAQWATFVLLALLGLLLFAAAWSNGRSMRAKHAALRRLEEVAARQEAIFNSAKDGIITITESGNIETFNPAAARMYGYEPHELVRRDVGILFEVAPDQGSVETFLKRLQRRRKSDAGQIQEFSGRRRDGTMFPTDVAVSPVRLPDGLRYVAIIRDSTERKQVEQMKSEFVSTVSHELRTPLTSIAGSLGLLAGGAAGELPENMRRLIEIARSNSERLVRLINDILDIEKIESGKMRFDLAPLALAPLLEEAMQANRGFADECKVQLELEPVPANAAIFADADRMMQVLTNLLSNAIKFSPEAGTVTISVTPLDRRFRISVADRGAGIAEEFRPRIFDKFAQADSTDTRQKGGTGLGLSIVREIVTRLGGGVSFDSSLGEGTRFHVDIPSAERSADAGSGAAAPNPLGGSGDPMVLHIEDDPDMLRLVASAFEGRARVYSSPSVEEARASLQRYGFDAVILDIGMADGSGLDLVPLIRSRKPRVPIVIFTAQDGAESFTKEVDATLIKSRASLDSLVETVEALLRGAPSGKKKRKA